MQIYTDIFHSKNITVNNQQAQHLKMRMAYQYVQANHSTCKQIAVPYITKCKQIYCQLQLNEVMIPVFSSFAFFLAYWP